MSCDGVVIGLPLAAKTVVRRSMSMRACHLGSTEERARGRPSGPVEVRVVSGTNERVNADGFAFDELRLESLDRETVQRRRAVQETRVPFVTSSRMSQTSGVCCSIIFFALTHGVHVAEFLEAANDERLEQDERHFLRQTALMKLELRTDDDDRTAE
jgi:hypothetical protein